MTRVQKVQLNIMKWYRHSGRDLPWRRTRDPYAIAISEVMLQQTQVDRVIPKYHAWLKTFPTVRQLAHAPLHRVLKLWSGLGYNSRGLRLRTMAQTVLQKHEGKIPTSVEVLQDLPGFGPYTAAAVATFAYRQRVPVIDTNIRRVLSRIFFGVRGPMSEKKLIRKVAAVLPTTRPDQWNHALMDIGAMICLARKPKCEECPVKNFCRAYPAILTTIPAAKKKPAPKFESTDRYWRGRIIATLLESGQPSVARLRQRLARVGTIDRRRVEKILHDLSRAGLIVRRQGRISISS